MKKSDKRKLKTKKKLAEILIPHNRDSMDNVHKLKNKSEMYIIKLQMFKSLKKKLKDLKAIASGEQMVIS